MAGTITYDVEGGTYTASLTNGNTWQRRFWITGLLAGGDPNNPDIPALIDEAFELIPDWGTPTPAPISGLFVRDSVIDRFWCEDRNVPSWGAEGTLIYQTPARSGYGAPGSVPDDDGPGITLSTSASVQEVDAYEDINGDQLITTYDNVDQAHRAIRFELSATHVFTRLEATHPRARIDTYVGKLNSDPWNGYAPLTILCSNIDVRSDDRNNWIVEYTFEFKPAERWRTVLIHDDPFYPGNPVPIDVNNPQARLEANLIESVAFGPLSIVLP